MIIEDAIILLTWPYGILCTNIAITKQNVVCVTMLILSTVNLQQKIL